MKWLGFIIDRFIKRFKPVRSIRSSENYLDFYKLGVNSWFADVHSWTASIMNLQMVMGADELLEYLAKGDRVVRLQISSVPSDGLHLKKTDDIYGGANYIIVDGPEDCTVKSVWLCGVNNYFWGGLAPDDIWFKRIPYTDKFSKQDDRI